MEESYADGPFTEYPVAAAANSPWPEAAGATGTIGQTQNAYRGDPLSEPAAYCRRNQHHFGCKHEIHCACGRTQRVEVPEGL